jgi:SAM-dependent methyltransferase
MPSVTTDWTKEAYTKNPDRYWNERGGDLYLQSLGPIHRMAEQTQRLFLRSVLERSLTATSLLDFGFGTGRFFDLWASIPNVFGLERSGPQMDVAKTLPFKYNLMLANGSHRAVLPYEDEQFDVIVASEVLNHIPQSEIGEVIGEFRRCLRPRGALALILAPPDHDFQFHSFNHDFRNVLYDNGFIVIEDYVKPKDKSGLDVVGHSRYRYLLAKREVKLMKSDRMYYSDLVGGG